MDTSPARLQRMLGLFETAADLPAAERNRFLADACGGDASLRVDVESMLAADATSDALPTSPTAWLGGGTLPTPEEEDLSRLRFGPWQVVGVLGRGGMGAVYRVERADGGFRQVAALKRIRIGLDTNEARQRFLRERQILATLRHPNIARLLDGGLAGDTPYFAMELIEGERMDRWCDGRQLDVRGRVRLFQQVLAAVAEAHRNLVVHRDLKASNVLVDAAGQVHLLDFGVAQLKEEGTEQTQTEHRAFTPDFASPEQLRAEPVTTTSDVYQLGMLLYSLLLGRHPFGIGPSTSWHRKLALLESAPIAPSKPVTDEIALARGSTAKAISRELSGDLEAILLRAIAHEPGERYASVDAMSDDLQAWLDGRTVKARLPSRREVFERSVRRNRIAWGAAAAVVLALVAGLGAAVMEARQAARSAEAMRKALASAELNASRSAAIKETFERMLMHAMMRDGGRRTTVRELIDNATRTVDTRSGRGDSARVSLLLDIVKIHLVTDQKDAARELLEKVRPRAVALMAQQPLFAFRLKSLEADFLKATDPAAPDRYRAALKLAEPYLAGADEAEFEDIRLARNVLMVALDTQGRYREQLAVAQQAFDETLRRYGEQNPRTLQAKIKLARAMVIVGQYRQANVLATEAIAHATAHFGTGSQFAAQGRSSQAIANLNTNGHWPQAEANLHELAILLANPRTDIMGERAVRARIHLARLLQWQRRDAEAAAELKRLQQAIAEVRNNPIEPALPITVKALEAEQAWNEGRVLASRNLAEEAVQMPAGEYDAAALDAREQARMMLARADADAGHCGKATQEAEQALRQFARFPQMPTRGLQWARAAEVTLRCGQPDAARRLSQLARADVRALPEPSGYQLGLVELTRARVLAATGATGATQAYRDADKALAEMLPFPHPLRVAIASEKRLVTQP